MPQKRFTISAMGKYLEPKIYNFLMENINDLRTRREVSVEIGAEMISHTIAHGMSLALSSQFMQTAFAVGITPPPIPPSTITPGGPIGNWIYALLKPNVIEP